MILKESSSSTGQNPVELLQKLIQFDTTNPPGNESECIGFINQLLTQAGIETKILAKSQQRPNLIARLPGQGHTSPLLLYGHVDVVTTENQDWKHPPFEAKIADGFICGRGALDMKGGIAMMLAAVLRSKAEGLNPAGDIILVILCDEEAGGEYGAKYLVENHSEQFAGIRYAIGEFGGVYRTCWGQEILSYSNCREASLLDKCHHTRTRWSRRPPHARWCNGKIGRFAVSSG
jgi:acetylornithine deacetylase/succinyl-diaminopimelate desuccinylase-like protein